MKLKICLFLLLIFVNSALPVCTRASDSSDTFRVLSNETDPQDMDIVPYLDIISSSIETNDVDTLRFNMTLRGTLLDSHLFINHTLDDHANYLWYLDIDQDINTGQKHALVGSEYNVILQAHHNKEDGVWMGRVDITHPDIPGGGFIDYVVIDNEFSLLVPLSYINNSNSFDWSTSCFARLNGTVLGNSPENVKYSITLNPISEYEEEPTIDFFDELTEIPNSEILGIFEEPVKIFTLGEDFVNEVNTVSLSVNVIDWNGDGSLDLLLSTYYPGYLILCFNYGEVTSPDFRDVFFVSKNRGERFETYHGPSPVVTDWDNDGDHDLLIGMWGYDRSYYNNGTNESPEFIPFDPETRMGYLISQSETAGYSTPFIVDWNNDGIKDILLGEGGFPGPGLRLYLSESQESIMRTVNFTYIQYENDDLKTRIKMYPFVVDINADNKIDLITREADAFKIFLNIGSESEPVLAEPICVPSSHPQGRMFSVIDWNVDGLLDIVYGDYEGNVYVMYGSNELLSLSDSESVIEPGEEPEILFEEEKETEEPASVDSSDGEIPGFPPISIFICVLILIYRTVQKRRTYQ